LLCAEGRESTAWSSIPEQQREQSEQFLEANQVQYKQDESGRELLYDDDGEHQ